MDYFVNTEKEPNVIYNKKMYLGISHTKIHIFNKDLTVPMHPFWFLIKKTKIVDCENNIISVIMNDIKIIKFIEKIEDYLSQELNKNINHSIIRKKNNYSYINMKFSENTICFNNSNKKINLEDLDFINNYLDIFFEIQYIIYDEESFKIIYNIKQIKENVLYNIQESIFAEPKPVNNILPVISGPPSMSNFGPPNIMPNLGPPNIMPNLGPPNIVPNLALPKPPEINKLKEPAPVRLVLTADQLAEQIKKLKKKDEQTKDNILEKKEYINAELSEENNDLNSKIRLVEISKMEKERLNKKIRIFLEEHSRIIQEIDNYNNI
jgi:hypothetical protein